MRSSRCGARRKRRSPNKGKRRKSERSPRVERFGKCTMALTTFQLGKPKIAAHVREELDRAGITAESIQCRSDGVHLPLGFTRLTITVSGTLSHLDLKTDEVEDCAVIVAGEPWRKTSAFIGRLVQPK